MALRHYVLLRSIFCILCDIFTVCLCAVCDYDCEENVNSLEDQHSKSMLVLVRLRWFGPFSMFVSLALHRRIDICCVR